MEKGEKISEFFNRIEKFTNGHNGAGHSVSRVEQMRELLLGSPETYDVTTEQFLDEDYNFEEASSKLVL